MKKKMNFLAVIPIYGTVIIMLWMFVQTIKQRIPMKRFVVYLASTALAGFLSILFSILLFIFIGKLFLTSTLINEHGIVMGFVLGGYLLNLFTFTMINKQTR